MKAIILAGGRGTRLMPVTCHMPKPLTPFFGSTVLGHLLALLRENGITDIRVTLGHLGDRIRDALGDGAGSGVTLSYTRETAPMGTAGSVALCRDFYGDEDFLVISGDAVCDFDFAPAAELHRERGAAATIVTCRRRDPRPFGLVLADGAGKVRRFLEKPRWEQVFTDCVNTGIYLLSPRALEAVPRGRNFDFSRDLFPLLLRRGETLCARTLPGYWCDIGTPESYLRCCGDVLGGQVSLPLLRGVSFAPEVPGVTVTAPCFLGEDVTLGAGSAVGPGCVLEKGTRLGKNARVTGSVLMGTAAGENFACDGAVVAPGCVFGDDCAVEPGAAVGPDLRFPDGRRVPRDASVYPGGEQEPGRGERPGELLRLAMAAGKRYGRVAVAHPGDGESALLAGLLTVGARLAGADAGAFPAAHAALASFAAGESGAALTLFLRTPGEGARLWFFDGAGLPLSRDALQELIRDAAETDTAAEAPGELLSLPDPAGRYRRSRAVGYCPGLPLHVGGDGAAAEDLKAVLAACGADMRPDEEGICCFFMGRDGELAQVADEDGVRYTPAQLWALLLRELAGQGETLLPLPERIPRAAGDAARARGARVLQLGVDPGAGAALRRRAETRDGIAAAVFLADLMYRRNTPMRRLMSGIAAFAAAEKSVPVTTGRGHVMDKLSRLDCEDAENGICLHVGGGSVRIFPHGEREELRILAQAHSAETAQELCDFWSKKAREFDT